MKLVEDQIHDFLMKKGYSIIDKLYTLIQPDGCVIQFVVWENGICIYKTITEFIKVYNDALEKNEKLKFIMKMNDGTPN